VTCGVLIDEVYNQTDYIFSAEYNASENAMNTYLIEVTVTDVTEEKLSVNHTWTVTVVDMATLYTDLLNQTEFLEELTELISKISYVCANLNPSNLDELNATLQEFDEKYGALLNQTGLLGNIKWLMERIEDLTEQISESQDNAANLSSLLDELNMTIEQLNVNLTAKWDALNTTIGDTEDAENKTKEMENKMNNAIEAKNKAEYKLAASVVCGVIGGIIAGFLVSFLLRKKLPKKG
jgi:chromosome segregation ATPase